MCQNCVNDFDELWPELNDGERESFMWCCTAFPVGNNTRERLVYLIGKCGKDLAACLQYADKELLEASEFGGCFET